MPVSNTLRKYQQNAIWALATSSGHRATVLYIITGVIEADGPHTAIIRGVLDKTSHVLTAVSVISGEHHNGPLVPMALFTHPYNPNVLYTVDMGDLTIKSTANAGASWKTEP